MKIPSGFEALGKPIPLWRKQEAYTCCSLMGSGDPGANMEVVGLMSTALERDHPYDALEAGQKVFDLTGAYRLMAVLLTTEKPKVRIPAGRL